MRLWDQHSEIGMDFACYVVVDGLLWREITWEYVADVELDGALRWKVRNAKGREVGHFPPPFRGDTWRLGYWASLNGELSGPLGVPAWLVRVWWCLFEIWHRAQVRKFAPWVALAPTIPQCRMW